MKPEEKDILQRAINDWKKKGMLSEEKSAELLTDITNTELEKNNIARYFFIIAISCIILSFGALFIDEKIIEQVKDYFALNNLIIAVAGSIITITWYTYIYKKRKRLSKDTFEAYNLLGNLLLLTSIVYFCKDIGFGPSYSGFLITIALIFIVISTIMQSYITWIAFVLALMGAYGAYTEWKSIEYLFLNMNYPMRYTVFGLLMIILSLLQKQSNALKFTQRITYIFGLLIFFTGLWGISIFGNYAKMEEWLLVRQIQVIGYSLIFALFAILAFIYGIKRNDTTTRDFGIAFILINLYSRYFEFFWDGMNKGLFFAILAISFWLIGKYFEKKRKLNRSN